jgi:hypothetical protein
MGGWVGVAVILRERQRPKDPSTPRRLSLLLGRKGVLRR